jgi:hypothetical protein
LGFHIANTVKDSANKNWTITTARIQAQAQEAYHRDLSLDRRLQYTVIDITKEERAGWMGTETPIREEPCRLKHHGTQTGTVTAEWLHRRGLLKGNEIPPHRNRTPANMEYLRRFAIDSAYTEEQGTTE